MPKYSASPVSSTIVTNGGGTARPRVQRCPSTNATAPPTATGSSVHGAMLPAVNAAPSTSSHRPMPGKLRRDSQGRP